jgi:hypothetical protein
MNTFLQLPLEVPGGFARRGLTASQRIGCTPKVVPPSISIEGCLQKNPIALSSREPVGPTSNSKLDSGRQYGIET